MLVTCITLTSYRRLVKSSLMLQSAVETRANTHNAYCNAAACMMGTLVYLRLAEQLHQLLVQLLWQLQEDLLLAA